MGCWKFCEIIILIIQKLQHKYCYRNPYETAKAQAFQPSQSLPSPTERQPREGERAVERDWSEFPWAGALKSIIDNVYYYYLMQEGLRNTVTYDSNAVQGNCEWVFLLKRLPHLTGTLEVRADFGPAPYSHSTAQTPSAILSALPTFNKDHKFYTPSFVLPEDKAKFDASDSQILISHSRKVEEFLQEKEQLLVPKPSKANRFCLICKESYDDYLTHISYPSHNRLLKASPFHKDIHELCSRMSPATKLQKNKKISKQPKKKNCSKPTSTRKQASLQKSSESLSTGLQTQMGQLCSPLK